MKNERAAPDWEERLTGFLCSIRSDRRVAGLVFDTLTREQLSGRRTMLSRQTEPGRSSAGSSIV